MLSRYAKTATADPLIYRHLKVSVHNYCIVVSMPKVELDIRKLDDEIRLKDVNSVRGYLLSHDLDVVYEEAPPKIRRIGATKAPQYIRTYSISLMEPEPEEKDSEILQRYEKAVEAIGRFEDHVESLKSDERSCAETLRETYRHNGSRLADTIRNFNKDMENIESTPERWAKFVAELVLFRGTTTAGTYGIFEGPLGDVDVDVAGTKMKGRDLALAASGVAFGITSVASHFWTRKKRNDFRRKLRDNVALIYGQGLAESLEDVHMYYPEYVVELTDGALARFLRKANASSKA